MSGIPQLAIIDINTARLHEEVDPLRVQCLKKQIANSAVLKDPVIATKFPGFNDYMIVDGATRTTALKELGYKHLLIQLIDYDKDEIKLKSWDHDIKKMSPKIIQAQVQKLPKAEIKIKPF